MAVVAEKLLPGEFANRGIAEGSTICADLARKVRQMKGTSVGESPEAVFGRLAG
jgi:hypothetical protein